jgi:hypothetical protein
LRYFFKSERSFGKWVKSALGFSSLQLNHLVESGADLTPLPSIARPDPNSLNAEAFAPFLFEFPDVPGSSDADG